MKVRSAQEMMKTNMLVKHYAGSISYGTNLPTSDVDFRGMFAADRINVIPTFFPVRECEDPTEEDTKLYELRHFMDLAVACNPNVVETLWVDESDIVATSPAYELLRSHRHRLLSSKIAFTTSGYALSQLKRIKGHNKWINNPQDEKAPEPKDFVSLVQNFGAAKVMPGNFHLVRDDYRLVPFGGELYGVYAMDGYQTYDNHGNLNTTFEGERHELGAPEMVVRFNKEVYRTAKEKHEQYWTWKKNRNKSRGKLEEAFGYDCYSDDTEFLTNNGWKLFDEVTDEDLLATFNPHSHEVKYQSPTERIDSTFTGNMYHFTGHHTDTLVTSNHHMFIRGHSRTTDTTGPWEFVRAAELPETFDTLRRISPKKKRQILPSGFDTNILSTYDMLDYLRVMGWFVSDGTIEFYENCKPKSLRITQSKPQSKLTQTITKQRNSGKLTCKHYLYEARGMSNCPENVWIFDSQTAEWLYRDCGHGSKDKRLPNWVFQLTKREMTTLLVALLQGGGSKKNHKKKTFGYHTTNHLLAGDVQRLAVLCGYETSTYTSKTDNMFEVYIDMNPKQHKRTTRSRVKKIPVTNKRIVCFMVPNFTLITRRNGQVGFHGNTKHAMHLVRLLRMGHEALTTGELIVKRPDAEELLEIRNGAWTYEEVVAYAEDMDKQVREVLYKTTSLRKKPDTKFAAQLTMDVYDMVWAQ